MEFGTKTVVRLLLAASLFATTVDASAADDARPLMRIEIDNDLFTPVHRDRDYTGGIAVTWSGDAVRNGVLSLQPALDWLDAAFESPSEGPDVQTVPAAQPFRKYARQVGAIAFTPGDLTVREAQHDDRPYASLVYMANGETTVSADESSSTVKTLTVGILGLPAFASAHRLLHRLTQSEPPDGYSHQISAGGEPTARFLIGRQDLWYQIPDARFELKSSIAASAGFLTESNAALSIRVGAFATPWWSETSELDNYISTPAPFERAPRWTRQLYLSAGVRVAARAYNSFVQGQFRHSDVRYSTDEVAPLVGSAWISVNAQSVYGTEVSYTLHYQSGELRHGVASGELLWGGVEISRYF
jgi:Uncharacterized protein conserved in bacteria (DUF2219)